MKKEKFLQVLKTSLIMMVISSVMIGYSSKTLNAEQVNPTNPRTSNGVTIWDCIYFGSYPQEDSTGQIKDPIKWRVLSVDGNDAFLIADSILYQTETFDSQDENVGCWKNSDVRAWLNAYGTSTQEQSSSGFLTEAFTTKEQAAILKQTIEGCNDYIYLPSKEEMTNEDYGFSNNEEDKDVARQARITNYAGTIQAGMHSASGYGDAQCYYLREFLKDNYGYMCMSEIHKDGSYSGGTFWVSGLGVRPVLHLDLSNDVWEMAGTVFSDNVAEQTSNDYQFFIYNDEAVITAYNGTETDLVIPDKLGGYPVGYIKSLAKAEDDIDYSDEEDGESNIDEDDKDTSGSLRAITFPDSVWGIENLQQKNLTQITFGSGIKKIGCRAFEDCTKLNSIYIPETVTMIEENAFSSCTGLTEVTIPGSVKKIEYSAFAFCTALEKVTLNSGIESIGSSVFYDCESLKTVYISSSIKEIEDYAFGYCENLTNVTIESESVLEKIGSNAFRSCNNLKQVEIPATVTKIEPFALGFYVKDEDESDDDYSNESYDKIEDFKLIVTKDSAGEQYAKEYGINYEYSGGTSSIINPSAPSVKPGTSDNTESTENKHEALQNDSTEQQSTEKQSTIENTISKGATITQKKLKYLVTVEDGKKHEVAYVGTENKTAKKIIIPASISINGITYKVTSIANGAFKNNKKVQSVVIGKNVTAIGDRAFYKCTKLSKISIPSKVSKIGKRAFYGCKKLKNITIKTQKLSSKKVGNEAFKGIHSKATIKVPKSKLKDYKKLLKKKGVGSKVKIKK